MTTRSMQAEPSDPTVSTPMHHPDRDDDGVPLGELLAALKARWKSLLAIPVAAAALAFGLSYLLPPTFTAKTTFLPPQQQQSAATAALSQIGALAGLAGGTAAMKNPADQYVSLMQSATVSDRIVDRFELMATYDTKLRVDARRKLSENVRIGVGKKDGLITVEVDDVQPKRAADMSNAYIEELRRITNNLALTEAQQRRAFFEDQLKATRDRLTQSQQALQASGFNVGALKTEPKAAAEIYARLSAQVTSAEVRLKTLRQYLADSTQEVQQQQGLLTALRDQVARAEVPTRTPEDGADYIGKYREFKYQESLFELFARQFELARLDESREGALIQVVDPAQVPERKSKPDRGLILIATLLSTFMLLTIWTILPCFTQRAAKGSAA